MLLICILFAGLGVLLGFSAHFFKVEGEPLVEKIDALLPQTQCAQCGFAGCKPYAIAIAHNEADINQCPPGGEETIVALANLLGQAIKPLNREFGETKPKQVAVIIEADCIGCAKCLPVCPVDAILGANKFMHTVIASECTGCELCIAPCPVDCIVMQPVPEKTPMIASRFESNLQRPALPCIRCGECAVVCPIHLLPQQLFWYGQANNISQLHAHHLEACIECGKCDLVCPSHIPLVQHFRDAKYHITLQQQHTEEAALAKRRYENQQQRQQRLLIEQAEKSRQQKQALADMKAKIAAKNKKQ
jgi:Na+-translocating ferredoxin:NAD+ oxidoreductase subunit B